MEKFYGHEVEEKKFSKYKKAIQLLYRELVEKQGVLTEKGLNAIEKRQIVPLAEWKARFDARLQFRNRDVEARVEVEKYFQFLDDLNATFGLKRYDCGRVVDYEFEKQEPETNFIVAAEKLADAILWAGKLHIREKFQPYLNDEEKFLQMKAEMEAEIKADVAKVSFAVPREVLLKRVSYHPQAMGGDIEKFAQWKREEINKTEPVTQFLYCYAETRWNNPSRFKNMEDEKE